MFCYIRRIHSDLWPLVDEKNHSLNSLRTPDLLTGIQVMSNPEHNATLCALRFFARR